MDLSTATLAPDGGNQPDRAVTNHPQQAADQKPKTVSQEESQMTINTAAETEAGSAAGPVTQQPRLIPGMVPENYVIRLENLGDSPDYIDCPYLQKSS